MITLQDAVEALLKRKEAAFSQALEAETLKVSTKEDFQALCVGFDVDIDEIVNVAMVLADGAGQTLMQATPVGGNEIREAFISLWIDGFLTAMMLGELRKHEGD